MARKKPPKTAAEADEFRSYWPLTPNQVVAWNLAQARSWRGWTQDQATEALERCLGVRWSKATYSQAERSVDGKNVRNFTADEIVAFARAFELPVTWFFMPPPAWAQPGVPVALDTPDAQRFGTAIALLVDLVFGDRGQQAELAVRLQGFLQDLGPAPLTDAQQRVRALAQHRIAALARDAFTDTEQLQTRLRSLANQLEDREAQAKRTVAADLDLDPAELGGPD
jgi:hypothetical protein